MKPNDTKSLYEIIIGIEVHVELKTNAKVFCGCSTEFGAPPNTLCCPVCMGLPGSLPVLNRRAVEYAIRAGIATDCKISEFSKFDRKNYFYPDLPKAYQISQLDHPLCRDGGITIECDGESKRIGITRIHLEEDAGKLIHREGETLIDFNRCGVPLIEIVSEPDMRSSAEAKAYLKKLRTLMLYAGVSDCKMNEGSLRCDVNVSVRRIGEEAFGVRTEIKNVNSFSFVGKAIEYEFKRQIEVIESGGELIQETRRFDEATGKTCPMRSKENADDYRYFPEPDIPPLHISAELVKRIASDIPRLPDERKADYVCRLGLGCYDADIITSDMEMADCFEAAAEHTGYHKILANLMISEIMSLVGDGSFRCEISPKNIAAVADLVGGGRINSSTAKKLVRRLWERDEDPMEIVVRESLEQIRDREKLVALVREAISGDTRSVSAYKSGKKNAAKAIVGKIMAVTEGRADPMLLSLLVTEELER